MTHSQQVIEATESAARDSGEGRTTRVALWVALAVSLIVNVVASSTEDYVLVGMGAGLVALALGVTLVMQHRRHRRR